MSATFKSQKGDQETYSYKISLKKAKLDFIIPFSVARMLLHYDE